MFYEPKYGYGSEACRDYCSLFRYYDFPSKNECPFLFLYFVISISPKCAAHIMHLLAAATYAPE